MFLFGNQVVNDYDISSLITFLVSSKAIEGKDYAYVGKDKIILYETSFIKKSKFCYRYYVEEINKEQPYIGRKIDYKNRIIIDYVYNKLNKYSRSLCPPWTLGWTYDYECSSVSKWIMGTVSKIPFEKRNDRMYVATYIASKIDNINDPFGALIEGRWKSTFSGGRSPTDWRSSGEVFRERLDSKLPVKYGQCWVLADLLTGIYRFLGFKSKSVRIENCIMDLHMCGGIDYTESSEEIMMKNGSIVNPRHLINSNNFEYISNSEFESKINTKGCLYSFNNDLPINMKDFYHIDDKFEKSDRAWNFHVWTEVEINNEWYVFDPSPLNDIKDFSPYTKDPRHPLLVGKRFLGPVKINDIKNANMKPVNGLEMNLKYLFSCVNGMVRHWSPLKCPKDEKTIMYLNNIRYGVPTVYERTRSKSKLDVTSRYRCDYDSLHKENPLYLKIKDNNIMEIHVYYRNYPIGEYIIQLCILLGTTPLYIHREFVHDINKVDFLSFLRKDEVLRYRQISDRLTFMIFDRKTNMVYFQGIRI